ncbi:MAG: acyltransferase [Campylobacterota bacterium]|nr:acyltransferase [Campylobacterota bacterium]
MKKKLLQLRAKFFSWLHQPRMLNNIYVNPNGELARNTRFSSTVDFVNQKNIYLGDNIFIWHNSILDGTAGLEIEEGCQIGANVSIFTHSSHMTIRLFGKNYSKNRGTKEDGYILKSVKIGKYSFISTGAVILPGVSVGKGCIVSSNSLITRNIPDYSIVQGNPAEIIGSTETIDKRYLKKNNQFKEYYNEWNNE